LVEHHDGALKVVVKGTAGVTLGNVRVKVGSEAIMKVRHETKKNDTHRNQQR
jgi:hypothetical protein